MGRFGSVVEGVKARVYGEVWGGGFKRVAARPCGEVSSKSSRRVLRQAQQKTGLSEQGWARDGHQTFKVFVLVLDMEFSVNLSPE